MMDALFDNDYGLPCVIFFYIMSMLDPFVVYNMRLVSKNWNHSIKNREFIQYYDEHAKISRDSRLVDCEIYPRGSFHNLFYTLSIRDRCPERCIQLKPHPQCQEKHHFDFVGTIEGILCMKHVPNMEHLSFVISNPLTGRNITILSPMMLPNNGNFFYYCR